MLPLCDSRAMLVPMKSGMPGVSPSMVPMMPMLNAPMMYPANNLNMFSTTTLMSEFDSRLYGRFRHVERENPRYRHAPFDWYRPPKQRYNVVHEDAAVVTNDGPVPIGDFYRYYIYGDGMDESDEYDDSSSFDSDEYGDTVEPSYEARSADYRRYPRRDPDLDNESIDTDFPATQRSAGATNYSRLNSGRQNTTAVNRPPAFRGTRTLAGDDDFDDTASVNSTYAN